MADRLEPKTPPRKGKINKDILLGILYAVFVVAAVGGMMLLDYVGEKKMDTMHAVHDNVDDH
jgi:hypothetical protein